MSTPHVSPELLLSVRADRQLIADESATLELQDARLAAAAAEDTVSGHLRRAIHASPRSLRDIAIEVGIDRAALCRFLEGEEAVSSDTLYRLAAAAGIVVSLTVHKG
jgi:hypothetical protein